MSDDSTAFADRVDAIAQSILRAVAVEFPDVTNDELALSLNLVKICHGSTQMGLYISGVLGHLGCNGPLVPGKGLANPGAILAKMVETGAAEMVAITKDRN